VYPDLTIGRPATWYTGAERDVLLNPLIEAYATGFGIQAHVSFDMKSNYDLPRLPGNTRRPATDCR